MKMKSVVLYGLLALTTIAFGAKEFVDRYGGQYPVWFNKGMYVGPNSPDPTASTINKITRIVACQAAFDYGTLSDTYPGFPTCADTSAVTCTGARVGDVCQVGALSTQSIDGGPIIISEGNLMCFVSATNAVKGRLCVMTADGGIYNVPDAGYNYIVTSNQAN